MVDIFLFGSALKSKEKPNDVDVIALFRGENYGRIEDVVYKIKKIGDALEADLHIEPIVVDNLHSEPIYASLLHEGFSIKNMAFLSRMLNFNSYVLFTYSLEDKKPSDKVRFSYALYGRKKGKGFLRSLNGKEVGRGSILVPTARQESAREFFAYWGVRCREQRAAFFEQ